MKKLLFTLIALISISSTQAQSIFGDNNQQNQEEDVTFFDNGDMNSTNSDPGGDGTDGDDYAPIDDYLPLLIGGAIALGFYANRKSLKKVY